MVRPLKKITFFAASLSVYTWNVRVLCIEEYMYFYIAYFNCVQEQFKLQWLYIRVRRFFFNHLLGKIFIQDFFLNLLVFVKFRLQS